MLKCFRICVSAIFLWSVSSGATVLSQEPPAIELGEDLSVGQDSNSDRVRFRVEVLTPEGKPADGAKVFVCVGDSMSLIGPMSKVELLSAASAPEYGPGGMDPGGFSDEAGGRIPATAVKGSVYKTVVKDGSFVVDLGLPPFAIESGGFEGLHNGFGGMGAPPSHATAVYYVVHPEHGCAFLPKRNSPPRRIQLKSAAKIEITTPGFFSADDFVVLACWRNRYADPIVDLPHTVPDHLFPGSVMDMGAGGMGAGPGPGIGGGMGGGMGAGMGASDVGRLGFPGSFTDWRLNTRVTHWSVISLAACKDNEGYNKATLVVPPGETRITLLPKSILKEETDGLMQRPNPSQVLERLSLFGGPTKIVRASPHQKNTYQGSILPAHPAFHLELLGRADVSGMPDWSGEQHLLFLTKYAPKDDNSEPINIRDQRAAIQYAESRLNQRSEFPFGRLAHKIGDQQYAAIGLKPGYYYVWSLQRDSLPELVRHIHEGDSAAIVRILQPLSASAVSPRQKKLFLEVVKKSNQGFQVKPTHDDSIATYRLRRHDAEFSKQPRTLIDLTRPLKFEPVDPKLDPFSAKTLPNEDVGVVTEDALRADVIRRDMAQRRNLQKHQEMDHIPVGQPVYPGEELFTVDGKSAQSLRSKNAELPKSNKAAEPKLDPLARQGQVGAPNQKESTRVDLEQLETLRRRVGRLEQELARAKRLLEALTPSAEPKAKSPRPARR